MSRTVGVIGQGNVGSAVAHQLVISGACDHLILFDENEEKVQANVLDFEDAMMNLPFHTEISFNALEHLKDCEVLISAVGKIDLIDENDRFAELRFNRQAVESISQTLKANHFDGILVNISNPCDVIASLYQKHTGLPNEHVIGTGTLLDSSRLHRALGEIFATDPRSIHGYSLGEHGNSQFVAWSTVEVNGIKGPDLPAAQHIDFQEITDNVRDGGFGVLNGKGYTNYGVAAAAVRLAITILNDSRSLLPVSHYLPKYDSYLSYPALVGRDGIIKTAKLQLTDEEEEQLQQSVNFIQEKVNMEG